MMRTINVGGRELPCRVTMGAMLRFKRETGRDVSGMSSDDVSDLVTFMWCCVVSACRADGVEMDLTLDEFADRLDPSGISEFYEDSQASKKSRRRRGSRRHRDTSGNGVGVRGDESVRL